MDNNLLVLLLIGHFFVDYYLQNDRMVQKKKMKIKYQLSHGLIYLVVNLLLVLPLGQVQLLVTVAILSLGHLLIDLCKFGLGRLIDGKNYGKMVRRLRKWEDRGIIYLTDQGLHLIMLMVIASLYTNIYGQVGYWQGPLGTWQIHNQSLRYLLAVMMILKPVNVTFRVLFGQNKPSDQTNFVQDLSAGKRIGSMERLLVLIFLLLNQYTAIGLVFTAKSVTRYNRIAEEPSFAEYYLLGTLFSLLATLIVYLIIIYL